MHKHDRFTADATTFTNCSRHYFGSRGNVRVHSTPVDIAESSQLGLSKRLEMVTNPSWLDSLVLDTIAWLIGFFTQRSQGFSIAVFPKTGTRLWNSRQILHRSLQHGINSPCSFSKLVFIEVAMRWRTLETDEWYQSARHHQKLWCDVSPAEKCQQ